MLRALAWILVASSMLAGCTMRPTPPELGAVPLDEELVWTATPIACPDRSLVDPRVRPSEEAPAPRWSPGDWWNYTVVDFGGRALGSQLYEVLSCVSIDGALAYRLRETALAWGEPRYEQETPRVRILDLDASTMNEVWARCNELGEGAWMKPCQGRRMTWDFPLREGKTWTEHCCGDVVMEHTHRVERAGDDAWLIHESANGFTTSTWTYTPSAQAFTRRTGVATGLIGPNDGASWELRDRGTGGAPDVALSFGNGLAFAPQCVHPEARGISRDAPALPPWRASGQGSVVRLADAVGDTLVGEPRVVDGRVFWNGTNGTFESWERAPSGAAGATWRSDDAQFGRMTEAQAGAWVQRTLQRFAYEEAPGLVISSEARRFDGIYIYYRQQVGNEMLAEIGGGASFRPHGIELSFGPLHVLPVTAPVNETLADETARAYMDCAMREMGRDETAGYVFQDAFPSGLAIRNETLARATMIAYTQPEPRSHCGERWRVFVDAQTGAIVGHETPICF